MHCSYFTALKFSTHMITLSAFWKNTRFGLNLPKKMLSQASTLFTFIAAFIRWVLLLCFLEQEPQALKVTLARHFQNRVDQILSYV